MTVVDLNPERASAAREKVHARAFLEMEIEMNDVVQLARICNLLCEDLPNDPRVAMLRFAVTDLADRIDRMHRKYYCPPSTDGD